MIVLGIECTAHTFGVGVINTENKEILVNERHIFKDEKDGMKPQELLKFHIRNLGTTLTNSIKKLHKKNLKLKDISLIAFSQGPGQGQCLRVASIVAKTLATYLDVKIVGVNHIRAHLEIGQFSTNFSDPIYLNVTGVNSQIASKNESGEYFVYGETEDVGLGNLLDYCGRLFGFGFPGGPKIEEYAKRSSHLIRLPYTVKGMNVTFAGLKSHIKQLLMKFDAQFLKNDEANFRGKIYTSKKEFVEDLCFSLQEVVFAELMEVVERALAYTNKKELILVGGVAANKRFIEMTRKMCSQRGVKYFSTLLELCTDNGVMIAWSGFVNRENAGKRVTQFRVKPYLTIEDCPTHS